MHGALERVAAHSVVCRSRLTPLLRDDPVFHKIEEGAEERKTRFLAEAVQRQDEAAKRARQDERPGATQGHQEEAGG